MDVFMHIFHKPFEAATPPPDGISSIIPGEALCYTKPLLTGPPPPQTPLPHVFRCGYAERRTLPLV